MLTTQRNILGFLFFGLLCGIYTHPMFGPGVFIAGDHPFYLSLLYATGQNVENPDRQLGGSAGGGGVLPFVSPFVPAPFSLLAISWLHRATSIPLPVLYKGVVFLALLFPAMVLWNLLSTRMTGMAAIAGVNLYLLLTYHLVQPLQGMWVHYLGLGMMILLLDYLHRVLASKIVFHQALLLSVFVLLIFLTDALTWPILIFLIPLTLVFYTRKRTISIRSLVQMVFMLSFAFVFMGIWIAFLFPQTDWGAEISMIRMTFLGLLARLSVWLLIPGGSGTVLADILPAIEQGNLIGAGFWAGRLLLEHLAEGIVIFFGLSGLVLFLRKFNRIEPDLQIFLQYMALVLLFFLPFLIGPWHFFDFSRRLSWVTPFRQDLFVPYLNVVLIIFSAYAIHELWPGVLRRRRVAGAIVASVLILLHAIRYSTYDTYVSLKTSKESIIYKELASVWDYLKQEVRPSKVGVLYEELAGIGFLDGGLTNLAALSSHETGVDSIVMQRPLTHFAFRQPVYWGTERPFGSIERITGLMKTLNCEYLVVWHLGIKKWLVRTGAMEVVFQSHNSLFSVLRVKDHQST